MLEVAKTPHHVMGPIWPLVAASWAQVLVLFIFRKQFLWIFLKLIAL
jgi:hypothetical protein